MSVGTFAFPLSFAQERLWFLDQLEPGSTAYNDPTALRISGALDEDALQCAFDEIVRRHEVLRTRFAAVDGVPSQIVMEPNPVPIGRVALGHEMDIHSMLLAEALRPFDLERGPLLRVNLARISSEEHILLISLHHIVCDGWSTAVLVRELKALYSAYARGEPSPLPDLEIQYADYAVWQRQQLQTAALDDHLRYWTQQLADCPPTLDLSTDFPRGDRTSFTAGHLSVDVPEALVDALQRLMREERTTLFMTLLTSFHVLLHRYTGQSDIVVGVPIAGRNQPETEPLIGFFVNTLALRARLHGNPTLRDVLRQVRAASLEAFEHQDLPWERVVDALHPVRDPRRTPVFQVLFAVQNTPDATFELQDLQVEQLSQPTTTAKFDLSLYAVESPGRLRLSFEYAAELFEHSTIRRLADHYVRVLTRVISSPGARVGDFPIVALDELPSHFDRRPRNPALTIPALFEAQLRRSPGRVAVYDGQCALTYAELDEYAGRVAQQLRQYGVAADVAVGICAERSVQLIAALLGILRAGGAYLPLDPGSPDDRLQYMLRDTNAPVVICDSHHRDRFRDSPFQVVSLEHAMDYQLDARLDPPPLHGDNLLAVIYTSGSTGQPKAVLCPHATAINRLQWMWEEYPFVEDEVCCQKTALAFVDSIAEIWSPLLSGIPLAVIDDPALKDPARLVAMLAEHRVTRIVGVPSLLATLLESAPSDISERLSRLRFCVSSGEPLPEDLARLFHQHLPRTRLLNLYGSSEVAADVTATEIGPDAPICVGQPIANAHVVILDQYLQPVPRGAIGEVCAGGGVLARGYLNAPGLTADRFIPDSFGHLPGARLYRTGDLGRWSVEGHLEVVGRRDHQVKIRGYRIETSEIEAALREHPSVSDAVVVAAGTGTARRLAAYVVARSRFAPTDLRTFLRARLPEYMLPAVYLELGAFPRTRTGKVDRRALPEPLESSHQTRAVFTSERQRQISAIWQDVLQTEQVGIDDNFFDVGGNSLLAVRLRSRLQSVLGTDLPLIELFRFPTIAAQAEYLGGASTPEVALARRMARQIDTQHRRRNLRQQHRREAISSDRWRVAEHS